MNQTRTTFLRAALLTLVLTGASSLLARTAVAAGAVEMQVDRIVKIAIMEYNSAMRDGNPAGWLKYFTDNVKRRGPRSAQDGKEAFAAYYAWEFENFTATWSTRRLLISGLSGAVEFEWDAVHKPTGTPVKVDMVAIFELASSGKFESLDFYFDTAKMGAYFADGRTTGE